MSRVGAYRSSVLVVGAACALAAPTLGAKAEGAGSPWRPVPADTARLFVLPTSSGAARAVAAVPRYTFLSSPHYSRGGRELAFTAQRCPRCSHLLALASSGLRVLSRNALRVVWYPRGRRLLFVHVSRHGTTLYSIEASGRGFKRVASERDSDGVSSFDTPVVAPDGARIAYAREIEPIESRCRRSRQTPRICSSKFPRASGSPPCFVAEP